VGLAVRELFLARKYVPFTLPKPPQSATLELRRQSSGAAVEIFFAGIEMTLEKPDTQKTMIVTGGSQGIGAGLVKAFLCRGYNVVANSRHITKSNEFEASNRLALVDGSIAESATATKIAEVAKSEFGSIDALVNNAGIYFSKHFTDYTIDDLHSLISVNIDGFFFISQLAIKQMLAQKTGGSIVNITTTMVDHPIAGINCAVAMITKGGLEAVTRSLAMEYAKQDIRVNAVAPGIVDTPMHKNDPKNFLKTLQPLGKMQDVKDIVDAIVYLSEAPQVTGEVLHVDGGAHVGKW
jgi:NAD(P)-dependent dehydrogenase (short-subunit alcohol dehydrogenase family)